MKNFKNKVTLDSKISFLKIANHNFNFTLTLSNVINSSLDQGIFPRQLIIARVVQIHKGGDRVTVSNYRPISLLTSFSKIYEKTMHNRILNFLRANNSLYEAQYGFRPGRSCEHAILNAQSVLLSSLNSNQIFLLLLIIIIDFSKDFDMVDHEILAKICSIMESDAKHQICTVSPKVASQVLYYSLYINDLPGISSIARFILYADDANCKYNHNS